MKKLLVFCCMVLAGVCIAGAFLIPTNEAESVPTEIGQDGILTSLEVKEYVSLPVIEALSVKESDLADFGTDTQEGTAGEDRGEEDGTIAESTEAEGTQEEAAFRELLRTAKTADNLKKGMTAIMDITVSQDESYIGQFTEYPLCLDDQVPEILKEQLDGASAGETVAADGIRFDGMENVDITATIKAVYDIPYPVTDAYMQAHTDYGSFSELITALERNEYIQDQEGVRERAVMNLIPYTMSLTTFAEPPESIVKNEMDILSNENSVQYKDARQSVQKILFLKAMLEKYPVVPEKEMTERMDSSLNNGNSEAGQAGMEDITSDIYRRERELYLSFEEDVTSYLYKVITIE